VRGVGQFELIVEDLLESPGDVRDEQPPCRELARIASTAANFASRGLFDEYYPTHRRSGVGGCGGQQRP
jgi:hypothetical protein